jgi:hypothetical protein
MRFVFLIFVHFCFSYCFANIDPRDYLYKRKGRSDVCTENSIREQNSQKRLARG